MIDHEDVALWFRARALTLVVCTTGSSTIAATAEGYDRASGSFLTEGFRPGMEVTPTGFTQTAVGVIEEVEATALKIVGGRTEQAPGASRVLHATLPEYRVWDNETFTPVQGRDYLVEELAPATSELKGLVRNGAVEDTGFYYLRWFTPEGKGPAAIYRQMDALLALFPPGAGTTLTDGVLRIRGDIAPTRSPLRPTGDGWTYSQLAVPYRHLSNNPS